MKETKITTADPSSLGLFGLAIVTLVASSAKLGITSGSSFLVPWALFLGGFAQLIAGIKDFQKDNAFGATAFSAYAFFWISVAFCWMIQNGVFGEAMASSIDGKQLGFAFLGYFIFSIYMTIGSIEANKTLLVIFVLIDVLLLCLTLSSLTGSHIAHVIAAYTELIISLVSFYGSAAVILNIHFGYEFLPLGKPLGIFKKPQAAIQTISKSELKEAVNVN